MKILEPTSLITDYILAAETLTLGILMLRNDAVNAQLSARLWALALLTTAVAAAAGGTYHGFIESLGPYAGTLWKVTTYAIGLTSLLMLSAAIFASLGGSVRTLLIAAAVVQFLVYAFWMAGHDDYKYVIYDYAPAMVVILVLQIIGFRIDSPSAGWITSGLLLSFAAAGVQQSGFSLHENFNHNDIYHVIQMVAMYLLYRGGLLLKDFRL